MNIPLSILSVVLSLLVILAGLLAWRATRNRASKFDFETAFLDTNGKTSMSRIGQFVALAVTTWAFIYTTTTDSLTEWFMTSYLGAWVLHSLGSKYMESKKESEK